MPKTKFQDFVFTVIMVLSMVYCMTCYNMILEEGAGYPVFLNAAKGMWFEVVVAFFAQKYIAGPYAKKMTMKFLRPGVDRPFFITIAMAGFTVSLMAPIMTLAVTIYHHGLVVDVFLFWMEKLVLNFPFALVIQIFYVGPFVRFVFRNLFRKQLTVAEAS